MCCMEIIYLWYIFSFYPTGTQVNFCIAAHKNIMLGYFIKKILTSKNKIAVQKIFDKFR